MRAAQIIISPIDASIFLMKASFIRQLNQLELPMKVTFILLLSILSLTAESFAHGPSRQKVVEKIVINAPIEKVWDSVKDFQNMNWHPAVVSTEGEGGNSIGAKRTLNLGPGASIVESLEKYNPAQHKFFYRIVDVDTAVVPISNYSSWFMLNETSEGHTEITWQGAFYRGYMNNNPPENLNDKAAIAAVTGIYVSGLNELKKILEE